MLIEKRWLVIFRHDDAKPNFLSLRPLKHVQRHVERAGTISFARSPREVVSARIDPGTFRCLNDF